MNRIKTLFLTLLLSVSAFGQFQDLFRLATGTLVYHSELYDSNDQLFGYFMIYEKDANDETKNMEFIFLDKNLNNVSNGTYQDYSYKSMYLFSHYYDCTLMGDYVVVNKMYGYKTAFTMDMPAVPLLASVQFFNLKDKTVSHEYKCDGGTFTELPADVSQLKKMNKKEETKTVVYPYTDTRHSGFFVYEFNKNYRDYEERNLKFFNEKRELLWNYDYNPDATRKNYHTFSFLTVRNDHVYLLIHKFVDGDHSEYIVKQLDIITGMERYDYHFDKETSEYSRTIRGKEMNGNLILVGNYCPFNKDGEFSNDKNMGFYRTIIDSAGNNMGTKYVPWKSLPTSLGIDEYGKVEKNFYLNPKRFFIFKDGSVSILTEKKAQKQGLFVTPGTKTSDFILFNFDMNFSVIGVDTIPKSITNNNSSDLLFSQYIKDDSGAVFFYTNSVKEGKETTVYLGINSIINGHLEREKIPLTSPKKYSILPYPAKEGYIMLREFNLNEKYDQIRLERLNY